MQVSKIVLGREAYEQARVGLWVINHENVTYLALPEHAQSYVGLDEYGAPMAWPIKGTA